MPHIPFSTSDRSNLRSLSLFMMVSAGLVVTSAVLGMLSAFIALIGSLDAAGMMCAMVQLVISGVLGFFLFRGSQSFKKVVDTDESDLTHLSEGLTWLRNYFFTKGAVLTSYFALGCLCFGGVMMMAMAMGAAFASH